MLTIQSFAFNPFSENTYILYNEHKNAFLVDPGNFSPQETEILQNFIQQNNLVVKNILLTHAHIDHVLGLQWAHDLFGVPVLMHGLDKEVLDRNPLSARQFGFNFQPFTGEINFIQEGTDLQLDKDVLSVYFVPGHSPGSVAYHSQAQKFIISGDVLFQGSIGRTDLYKGSHEQLLQSIRTQLFVLDEDTEVFSGHGNPTTIGFEKLHNPFF
jgi:glyoxylase-like metal-dependent hydrolase (beta-lactamase superfamily II)